LSTVVGHDERVYNKNVEILPIMVWDIGGIE
jgi:hypothetical protein